jgi:hypothetical protein
MIQRFSVNPTWKSRLLGLVCVLVFLLCVFVTQPVAEIGMNDDWSYIKTAQLLAATGHIVYNGWATAMLGWQLYFGALFIKLFGPSFTAVRASTVFVASATTFLTHRTLVRSGVNSVNATVATLALVLSPLFLPLALSFMSDVGGLFCIIVCLYACLRALKAQKDLSALAWVAFAALSNAVGGTIRQIAWLGVLVLVPSAVWLLRGRRYLVWASVFLYGISVIFICASLQWFLRQPYSIIEPILPGKIEGETLYQAAVQFTGFLFAGVMFLLPVLLAFGSGISFRDRRTSGFLIVGGALCLVIGLSLLWRDPGSLAAFLAPYAGNYVTRSGMVDGTPIQGMRPDVLGLEIRMVLTATVLAAIVMFLAFLRFGCRHSGPSHLQSEISFNNLMVLVVPFTVAYFVLLVPRSISIFARLMDRYLLPLLLMGMLLMVRLFQDRVQEKLPTISIVLTALFGVFAVAGTHDAFSFYRAKARAINELREAGIPDTSIDGGFEHNGMVQIESVGHINDPRVHVPGVVFFDNGSKFPKDCEPVQRARTPVIVPGYALSFDPAACGGLSGFASVPYRDWLRARTVNIYIVNTFRQSPVDP